jgi:hypothetical protein
MGRSAVLQAPEIGTRFGRGVVIDNIYLYAGRQHPGHPGERGCRLQCDCGNVYDVTLTKLVGADAGHTRSCGCLARELQSTHGLSGHPLYRTWEGMLARCENPTSTSYENYGGRGIEVCKRWHDPAAFIADIEAAIGPRPAGMTLDRWPDNDGPYAPGKVRWATDSEQAKNRRPPTATHRAKTSAALRGRRTGEENPGAKLTWEKAEEIRALNYFGLNQIQLAEMYDTCKANIGKIVRNETWISNGN